MILNLPKPTAPQIACVSAVYRFLVGPARSTSYRCRASLATLAGRDAPVQGDGERDEDEQDAEAPCERLPAFRANGPVEEEAADGVHDQGNGLVVGEGAEHVWHVVGLDEGA